MIFAREANNWEVDLFSSFFDRLYLSLVGSNNDDRLICGSSKKGVYIVKSLYNVLCAHDKTSFPWKFIWRNKAPPQMNFFVRHWGEFLHWIM